MTEKQTLASENEQSSSTINTSEVCSQEEIDKFNDWAATGAAQRIMSDSLATETVAPRTSTPSSELASRKMYQNRKPSPISTRNRIVSTAAGTVIGVGGMTGIGYTAHEAFEPATFSEETTTYTVQPGDGLFSAAAQVEGIETIDMRDAVEHIDSDPANIDVLSDGLQPGEQLIIPVSVEGYDATDEIGRAHV